MSLTMIMRKAEEHLQEKADKCVSILEYILIFENDSVGKWINLLLVMNILILLVNISHHKVKSVFTHASASLLSHY